MRHEATSRWEPGDAPAVFLSAGIGATPVVAMLHALAAEASPREVWWLYGARRGSDHPFAQEVRTLLKTLAHGHSHIRYSAPDPEDRQGVDFDARGRLDMGVLRNWVCRAMPAFTSAGQRSLSVT